MTTATRRLERRAAIVTGAGAGNGEAIARVFAREGARLVCADLDGEAAERVAVSIRGDGGDAVAVRMDHTDASDCATTVERSLDAFGTVDVLVNNAGVAILGGIDEIDEAAFIRQLRVNVVGPFLMSQAVLPEMIRRGRGAIVNIASRAGLFAGQKGVAYVASKHALVGMTKALAVDHARHGIRVNAVCPALIRTRMAEGYVEERAQRFGTTPQAVLADFAGTYPLGRIGEPEDVAEAALHLAGDESRWVTGITYLLDGGQALLGPELPVPVTAAVPGGLSVAAIHSPATDEAVKSLAGG
jgi:NAD(P)-dependent dehydrogenase (short-subunit alcohol dehydrogenase family)